MKAIRFFSVLIALYAGISTTLQAHPETLRVGVIPYLTPNVLIALFQPLRQQLEKNTGRPIALFTAPDVRSFARRTLKPDFDLLITAAHQARLAQVEGGYLPLARFTGPLHATMIVAKDSPTQQLGELRGKRIAVTDRSILVNIAMSKILTDQGIQEKDVQYVAVNSQNGAILAVGRGEADAAIIAHFALDQSPEDQRNSVRSMFRSEALPNVIMLASPKLDPRLRDQISKSLIALPNTPEGSNFLEKSRYIGIQATDETFMKRLDGYLPETRKQLGL